MFDIGSDIEKDKAVRAVTAKPELTLRREDAKENSGRHDNKTTDHSTTAAAT
jgi:hypothetical protein